MNLAESSVTPSGDAMKNSGPDAANNDNATLTAHFVPMAVARQPANGVATSMPAVHEATASDATVPVGIAERADATTPDTRPHMNPPNVDDDMDI